MKAKDSDQVLHTEISQDFLNLLMIIRPVDDDMMSFHNFMLMILILKLFCNL